MRFRESPTGGQMSNGIIYTHDSIHKALQKYLDELWQEKVKPTGAAKKHVPSIEKINHLRDALVANMVGVIMYLQQDYPGIIILEDLDMEKIEEHFKQLNINISRRLEFALYRKFQSLGKAPPHLKDLIQRRERIHAKRKQEIGEAADKQYRSKKNFSSQIGAIVFVDEYNTSVVC